MKIDVGVAITDALLRDMLKDLERWNHGPWFASMWHEYRVLRCKCCGLVSLSGIPEPDNPWLPRWCHRRR